MENTTEKKEQLPKVTCAIILNQKSEVLFIKRGRSPFMGQWALVSGIGASKDGAMPDEAICREVEWDLGTKSFSGKKVFSKQIENSKETDEVAVYLGQIDESEIVLRPGFSDDIRWLSPELAVKEKLAFDHNEILQHCLNLKQ